MKKFIFLLAVMLAAPSVMAEYKLELMGSTGKLECAIESLDLKVHSFSRAVFGGNKKCDIQGRKLVSSYDLSFVADTKVSFDEALLFGVSKTFEEGFWNTAKVGIYARSQWGKFSDVGAHVSMFAEKRFDWSSELLMWENRIDAYSSHGAKSSGYKVTSALFVDVTQYLGTFKKHMDSAGGDFRIWVGVSHTVSNSFDITTPKETMLALRISI